MTLSLFFCSHRAAALPVYEPFADMTAYGGTAYNVTSNLWGQTNYPTGRWQGVGTSGVSGVMPVIAAGNLSYTGLSPSTGNSVSFQPSSGGGARLNLTNNIGGSPNSIYYSFLLKITDLSAVPTFATNNAFMALCDDPREQTAQVARLGARMLTKKSGAGYVLGIGRNNTTTDYAYDTTVHNVGETVFVVACNVLNGGTTNVSIWVDPPVSSFGSNAPPAASATAVLYSSTTGGINASGPQSLALICQFAGAPSGVIDDIRVGSTWAAATGAPDVAIPPTNQTYNAGSTVSFSVLAFGVTPFSYRWQKNGANMSDGGNVTGSGTTTLTISNVLSSDAASYALVISNAYGVITTTSATLTVNDPAITTQPASQTLPPGTNASLHVVAVGTPTLTYQWYKDNSPLSDGGRISGSSSANLSITGFTSGDAGTYDVVVMNGLSSSVTSSNAILATTDPSITTEPQNSTNVYGTTATFQVVASGTPPFSYQWQKIGTGPLSDGGNISGSKSNILTISTVSLPDAGTYFVTVTNAIGSVDSVAAVLVVRDPAVIAGPTSTNIPAGTTATFHVVAVGTPTLSYEWTKNGNILFDGGNISGSGTDTLTVSGVSTSDQGSYAVDVTGGFSTTETSSNAVLTIATAFAITAQPTPRAVVPGSTTALAVGATGNSLQYQWQLGGSNISGATAFAYVITNVQAAATGSYRVIVSSSGNSLTSSPAAVSLVSPLLFADTNVVVIRVGDGAQAESANGNTMFLDQFAKDGTYLSTLAVPNSGAYAMVGIGPNVVTVGANSSITGNSLSRSADGLHLSFAGYATNLTYGAPLQNSTDVAVPRGVGLIDAQGHYALALAVTNAFNTAVWRGAVTDGTNNYYGHARTSGTYYFGYNAPATAVQTNWANTRSMAIFNNNIFIVSAVNTLDGIMELPGMPTNLITSPTVIIPGSTGSSDCEVSPDGNTIYLADDGGSGSGAGVQKWHFDGTSWSQLYILTVGSGARYVTADFSGANPVVYAVTTEDGNNSIVRIVDTGAGSTGTTIAYSGVNQNFRGLRFGPHSATLARPSIAFSADASNDLLLNWPGPFYLQSSTNVAGPYLDVINGTRIYTNPMPAISQKYFRLRQ